MKESIILKDFILEKYNEAKVPEQTLEVIFENKNQSLGNGSAQEKCKGIIWPFSRSPMKNITVKRKQILVESQLDSKNAKEIMEITLDTEDLQEFEWQPGDTIAILPINSYEKVEELLQLLDIESKSDTVCSINVARLCTKKSAKVPAYIPVSTTPREILRDCLNLNTVLKKTFLRSLADYCSDNEEKAFLKCLSSKEGSTFYNDLIMEKAYTINDILKLCPTCKPPFSLMVEHLTRLLPRPYSIANSPLKTSKEICIIFSISEKNPGVTTQMLKEKCQEESSKIPIYLREPNNFRYTADNYQENQILIAIGTGLAPFLGFLQHKQKIMESEKTENPGITWLFVGTTSEEAVIHREELLKWQSKNVLNNFVTSYSRVPTADFHYVQDSLESNAQEFVELLLKTNTTLYLCADGGQISKSIESTIQKILAKELTLTNEEAVEVLKDFKAKKKYREDIWL